MSKKLLERKDNAQIIENIRDSYSINSSPRKPEIRGVAISLLPFQDNLCFYCCQEMKDGNIQVDHCLARKIMQNDQIWNLVPCHSECNISKGHKVVTKNFIEKLIARIEKIIKSNHIVKNEIIEQLGRTAGERKIAVFSHYENVKLLSDNKYWQR